MTFPKFLKIALVFIAVTACAGERGVDETGLEAASMKALVYPQTAKTDQTDDYFGVTVADPYRWLEDDVRESEAVADWVAAQNDVTNDYLTTLPGRAKIKARLHELWDYEKFRLPIARGDRYFFRRNDGLQNQYVLYVQNGLDATPRILLDPNSWSDDGATALASYLPSPDGSRVLYSVQEGGSDWRTLKVVDVASGAVLEDEIEWVKFSSLTWAKDGAGFYYSRFPKPEEGEEFQALNFNQAVYYHKLGDSQSADKLVYARPDEPEHSFAAEVSSDGAVLVITVWKGTDDRYEVVLIDLTKENATPVELVSGFEFDYSYIATADGRHFFKTNAYAPRGRIVSTPSGQIEAQWEEVVPQAAGVISSAGIVGQKLIVNYLDDVKSKVQVLALDGSQQGDLPLPGVGSASGFGGQPDAGETFYSFESFNQPPTIYRYDMATGEQSVFKRTDVNIDPDQYVVEQVFYRSKDGAEIPMFVSYKKGFDRAFGAPALLFGYGGFNISLEPSFSITRLAWMEMGGVYAVANLRGGGEYGKEWHDAGRLLNKQNVFDDFIAAGEYLIDEGYTREGQLGMFGGSNGGLLVGAVANQRPDLFAAALPAVGVMDMLRFNRFTAGRFWVDDYGDPSSEEDFKNLRAYSPYHNIKDGVDYPATLVTTADTDDRVVPGHSFKYIAALQAADAGDAPHLIRIETRAGHGAGKPTDKTIEEYADRWAFLAAHTGLQVE